MKPYKTGEAVSMHNQFIVLYVVLFYDNDSPTGAGLGVHLNDTFTSVPHLKLLRDAINETISSRMTELGAGEN